MRSTQSSDVKGRKMASQSYLIDFVIRNDICADDKHMHIQKYYRFIDFCDLNSPNTGEIYLEIYQVMNDTNVVYS